jgi:hypothetical protein
MTSKSMSTIGCVAVLVATLPVTAVAADTDASSYSGGNLTTVEAPGQLGEHPAVLVHRHWSERGYDYASKFYPHPAWLALLPEAPREMDEHPALPKAGVITARSQEIHSRLGH